MTETVLAHLSTRCGTISARRPLTANMIELQITGLHGFDPPDGDSFAFVMHSDVEGLLVDGYSIERYLDDAGVGRVDGAYYTVRAWDASSSTLTVWALLHHRVDGVGRWLASAPSGHDVAVWGPRVGARPSAESIDLVLLGDETAAAAIARLIESNPRRGPITAIIEVDQPGDELPMPSHPQLRLAWAYRNGANSADSELLLEAAERTTMGDTTWVFVAGERSVVKKVRTHCRVDRALLARQVSSTVYWQRPRS